LAVLDDTPIVPGEQRAAFAEDEKLRTILASAEDELKGWQPNWEELPASGALQTSSAGVPIGDGSAQHSVGESATLGHKEHQEIPQSTATTEASVAGETEQPALTVAA
jgi:hypothetical protein